MQEPGAFLDGAALGAAFQCREALHDTPVP